MLVECADMQAGLANRRPETQKKVEILSPITGTVEAMHTVIGIVNPAGPVRVFVLYPDGKWRSFEAKLITMPKGGAFWSAPCRFGRDDSPAGNYDIVAVCGQAVQPRPLSKIPDGSYKSRTVHVRRGAVDSRTVKPGA